MKAPFSYHPPRPAVSPPFSGLLSLTITKYDAPSATLKAELFLIIDAQDNSGTIKDAAMSFQEETRENVLSPVREWQHYDLPQVKQREETNSQTGKNYDEAYIHETVTLPLEPRRSLLLFPFDVYRTRLSIQACVNARKRACLEAPLNNLFIRAFKLTCQVCQIEPSLKQRVSATYQGAPIQTFAPQVTYTRHAFLRFTLVVVGLLATVVFALLLRFSDKQELLRGTLGYFGSLAALRALIVPKDFPVFPTLVDYIILITFLFVSITIVAKFFERRRPVKRTRCIKSLPSLVLAGVLATSGISWGQTSSKPPMIVGGVVPIVNIEGMDAGTIKLDEATLAKIYRGAIKEWDDLAIKALNPEVKLPHLAISVVQKQVSDGASLSWPTSMGANDNKGMAADVNRINGAIGHVGYAFALLHPVTYISSAQEPSDIGHRYTSTDGKIAVELTDNAYRSTTPIRYQAATNSTVTAFGFKSNPLQQRLQVETQIGFANGRPVFITLDAEPSTDPKEPTFSPETMSSLRTLLREMGPSSIICPGEKTCTKTCGKKCCEWAC